MSTAGLFEFVCAGLPAATKLPAGQENQERVGAPRRRRKALRGGRRQQSRRQVGKTRSVLARPDEGQDNMK